MGEQRSPKNAPDSAAPPASSKGTPHSTRHGNADGSHRGRGAKRCPCQNRDYAVEEEHRGNKDLRPYQRDGIVHDGGNDAGGAPQTRKHPDHRQHSQYLSDGGDTVPAHARHQHGGPAALPGIEAKRRQTDEQRVHGRRPGEDGSHQRREEYPQCNNFHYQLLPSCIRIRASRALDHEAEGPLCVSGHLCTCRISL